MADSYGKVSNISGYDELRKVARSGERIVDTQALLKKIKDAKVMRNQRKSIAMSDKQKANINKPRAKDIVDEKLTQIYLKGKDVVEKGKDFIDDKVIQPAKNIYNDIEDAQLRAKYLKDLEEQERLASGESAEVETKAEFQARIDAKRKQDNPPVSEEIPDSEQVTYENRLKGAKADVQESIKDIKSAPGEFAKDFKEQIADPIDRGLRTSPNLRLLKRGVLPMTMMKRGEIYELLGEVLTNQDLSEEDRQRMISDIQQELRYSSSMAGSREGTEQRPRPIADKIKKLFEKPEPRNAFEMDEVVVRPEKDAPQSKLKRPGQRLQEAVDALRNQETQDSPKQKAVIDTIKKFEGGNRSDTHNNPGAVIYTPGMEKLAEELGISIERGKEFKGSDGREYNTIQFANKDDGAKLLSRLIETKISDPKYNNFTSKDDVKKFVEEYTGLDADSSTVKNYTDDMWKNMSKIKGGFISMRSN